MLQRTQGRRATVAWSMLAELQNILVFQTAEHKDRKGAGCDTRTHVKKVHSVVSISEQFFALLFAVVHAAEHAPISWHRAKRVFVPSGATAERCIVVTVVQRIVGQADQRKTKKQSHLGRLGDMDVWTRDEGKERSLYNKGASGAQKRRE